MATSPTQQPVSISASGDSIVIARQQGTPIYVWRVVLSLSGETTVQFKRSSIAISGPMPALTIDLAGEPLFTTNNGDDFVISLGAAVQCGGTIWFSYGR